MTAFLAVRDNDQQKALALRPLSDEEDGEGFATLYATTRRQYPAPRYDVTIGDARDLETFLRTYPRYRMGGEQKGGGGDGSATQQVP
jgi:hypothetical protein